MPSTQTRQPVQVLSIKKTDFDFDDMTNTNGDIVRKPRLPIDAEVGRSAAYVNPSYEATDHTERLSSVSPIRSSGSFPIDDTYDHMYDNKAFTNDKSPTSHHTSPYITERQANGNKFNLDSVDSANRNKRNTQSHESTYQKKDRRCRYFAFFCLFILILCAIAGAVVYFLVYFKPTSITEPTKPAIPIAEYLFDGAMTLEEPFSIDLTNPSSSTFQNLSQQFIKTMDSTLRTSLYSQTYNKTSILEFRNGSIVVLFELLFLREDFSTAPLLKENDILSTVSFGFIQAVKAGSFPHVVSYESIELKLKTEPVTTVAITTSSEYMSSSTSLPTNDTSAVPGTSSTLTHTSQSINSTTATTPSTYSPSTTLPTTIAITTVPRGCVDRGTVYPDETTIGDPYPACTQKLCSCSGVTSCHWVYVDSWECIHGRTSPATTTPSTTTEAVTMVPTTSAAITEVSTMPSESTTNPTTIPRQCRSNTIQDCRAMVNSTHFPNYLNHMTPEDATIAMNMWKPLVAINCSVHLVELLCYVHSPYCDEGTLRTPPCRQLCDIVQQGCAQSIQKFGFPLPTWLNCAKYPNGIPGIGNCLFGSYTPPTTVNCTFESGMCGYKNVSNGYIWQRRTGYVQDGPQYDHTLGNNLGYYIYTTLTNVSSNQSITLESPTLYNVGIQRCLQFYLHMHNAGLNPAVVKIFSVNNTKKIWLSTVAGERRKAWIPVAVTLPVDTVAYILEVSSQTTTNVNDPPVVAVDDIVMTNNICPVPVCTELEWHCKSSPVCIQSYQQCDGYQHCPDASDEENCACPLGQRQCTGDSKCIMAEWVCDGHVDCSNGTDERNCSGCSSNTHTCGDYSCIPWSQRCDGEKNCKDGSDESNCVRIESRQQTVQVYYQDQWSSICYDTWRAVYNNATCYSLGKGPALLDSGVVDVQANYLSVRNSTVSGTNLLDSLQTTSNCTSGKSLMLKCAERECGYAPLGGASSKIVHGTDAAPGSWPWQVSVQINNGHTCGGVVINEEWVLTAAHCVRGYAPRDISVVYGATSLRFESSQQRIEVFKVILHPLSVSDFSKGNDAALLFMVARVNYTNFIRPICLPTVDALPPLTSLCYTVGWGHLFFGATKYAEVLQEAKMPLWSIDRCNGSSSRDGSMDRSQMCAGYFSGYISTCQADSGGPLMCLNSKKLWEVVGVSSFARRGCNVPRYPPIFIRVGYLLPWINEKTVCQFSCKNGVCLYNSTEICNGVNDCIDNSDELNCMNACSVNKGNCSHTCVPIGMNKRECRCPAGFTLGADQITCISTCQAGLYRCNNGQCVAGVVHGVSAKCDHRLDCKDYSDEKNCNHTCLAHQFKCASGPCRDIKFWCDQNNNCGDGSDEPPNCQCRPEQFRCGTSGPCILGHNFCDGKTDCPAGQDEPSGCTCDPRWSITCPSDNKCIPDFRKCDLYNDCSDGFDELNCTCGAGTVTCATSGKCLTASKYCDGMVDCPDASDEPINCTCTSDQLTCTNGQCKNAAMRCDGYYDCYDKSDEIGCECYANEFKCSNDICIPGKQKCDGIVQCDDLSDETNCTCVSSEIRCANGKCVPSYSRCDGKDDCGDMSDEANCACEKEEHKCPDGKCILKEWLCDRNIDCVNGTDEQNCHVCSSSEFVCHDYTCIPSNETCDGVSNCPDGSDEEQCARLLRSNTTIHNVLELKNQGLWYPVCSKAWNNSWDDLVCKQLGHGPATVTGEANQSASYYWIPRANNPQSNLIQGLLSISSQCTGQTVRKLVCELKDCGVQKADRVRSFITGGEYSPEGAWPWAANIRYLGVHRCGGTLINRQWIVTAAHCFKGGIEVVPQYFEVVLASVNVRSLGPHSQTVKVSQIFKHPNFIDTFTDGSKNISSDIALMKLSTPVTINDYVKPACLPEPNTTPPLSRYCYVVGWGLTDKTLRTTSPLLKEAKMDLWSTSRCRIRMPKETLIDTKICAGYESALVTACDGDSGGGLVCQDGNRKWVLEGALSTGPDHCNRNRVPAVPNIFTKVSLVIDWIHDTIAHNP